MITTSVGEIKFNFTKLKKKKTGACVFLSTVFFLSLLAGKFTTTEVIYRIIKQKNWRMRILGARIFLSFLAGKF